MGKHVLIVTPRFPYPETGACEQDRAEGIRQLKALGFEVCVIGKVFDWQNKKDIIKYWGSEGVSVSLVEYKYHRLQIFGRLKQISRALANPAYLDGAAYEYTDPEIVSMLKTELKESKPDLVWFDYTYLWPLYKFVKEAGIPIITRSINIESRHFLEEDGKTLFNYLKSVPKFLSEKIISKESDLVFSINKNEEQYYNSISAKVVNLPLRALPKKLDTHEPRDVNRLNVFFSGSTYNVAHNRRALEFIIKEVAPEIIKRYGDIFTFYITGHKFPDDLKKYLNESVQHVVPEEYAIFLQDMDIALVPSFFGAGMQQKIFEPLARGFPTITHARGLGGYDFMADKEVLLADDLSSFCSALESLRSSEKRKELSQNAKAKSKILFSKDVLDKIVMDSLKFCSL